MLVLAGGRRGVYRACRPAWPAVSLLGDPLTLASCPSVPCGLEVQSRPPAEYFGSEWLRLTPRLSVHSSVFLYSVDTC